MAEQTAIVIWDLVRDDPKALQSLTRLRSRAKTKLAPLDARPASASPPPPMAYAPPPPTVSPPEMNLQINAHPRPLTIPLSLLWIAAMLVIFAVNQKGSSTISPALVSAAMLLASILGGIGFVLTGSRLAAKAAKAGGPRGDINAESDHPLSELEHFARGEAERLKLSYSLQLKIVIGVGIAFSVVLAWALVMASRKDTETAAYLGSGSLGGAVMTQWKWQPFEKIGEARRVASAADALSMGLRMRMRTISGIADPIARQAAEWTAVTEFLAANRGP